MAKVVKTIGQGMRKREVVEYSGADAVDPVRAWANRNHALGPFEAACERNVEIARNVLTILDGLEDKPAGDLEHAARRVVETHRNAVALLAAGKIDGGMAAAYRLGELIGEARQVLRWSATVETEQRRTASLIGEAQDRSDRARRRDEAWLPIALAQMRDKRWSAAETAAWVAKKDFAPKRGQCPLSERQIRRRIGAAK